MECKFPEIISELRRSHNITQKKAAADLGVKQALLSHYENGIRECGLDFLIRLSEYYGVTTDELLGVSNNSKKMSKEVAQSLQKIINEAQHTLDSQNQDL